MNGGMKDMLTAPECGVLINPLNPKDIAKEVVKLLKNPDQRNALGHFARAAAATKYNADTIGPLMEESYEKAIAAIKV
jgi:glycosyltransferase involved in cell wall biosynthesis